MLFLKAFLVGLGLTLGMEIALGFAHALKVVMRGNKK
jgi:hypothetical protein